MSAPRKPLHKGLLAGGIVVGLGVGVVAGGIGAGPAPEQVSVIVAARDLAVGERVTEADFTELQVSKEWVTSSLVKPEFREYVLGKPVLLPVMKGDLISWSLFEITLDSTLHESCARVTGQPAAAAEQVSRARQLLLERPRQDAPAEP